MWMLCGWLAFETASGNASAVACLHVADDADDVSDEQVKV
jgi:hypothetical protein